MDTPPTDEEAQEAARLWVAAERRIRMESLTLSAILFSVAIVLSIVLAVTGNLWWNVPGIMSMATATHYLIAAWKRRKI